MDHSLGSQPADHEPVLFQNAGKDSSSLRRLHVAVLSLIFAECGRLDWKAPLTLRAVCRWWHFVVQGACSAWSNFEITRSTHADMVTLWLHHSRSPLHLTVHPLGSSEALSAVLLSGANSPVCLNIFTHPQILLNSFPNLEVLRIGGYNATVTSRSKLENSKAKKEAFKLIHGRADRNDSLLHSSRFPRLTTLHLHGTSPKLIRQIAKAHFSPIQELYIIVVNRSWKSIVERAAPSLRKLHLHIDMRKYPAGRAFVDGVRAYFPKLTHFSLSGLFDPACPVIEASVSMGTIPDKTPTPALTHYHENSSGRGCFPHHWNTSGVKFVVFDGEKNVEWESLRSVKQVAMRKSVSVAIADLQGLLASPSLCKFLRKVVIHVREGETMDHIKWECLHSLSEELQASRNVILGVVTSKIAHQYPLADPHKYFTYCTCNV